MSSAESAIQQQVHSLYHHHHGWLLGWLRRKLDGAQLAADSAADLAQDTFVRILVACQTRELAPEGLREPRAYLSTVAGRLLLNHRRRLSLEQAWCAALASQPEAWAGSPEAQLIVIETLQEIDAALDLLPPKARSAFLLSQFEGLSYPQIAARLGVTVRSVKRYMALAFEECLLRMA